jgi:hypothetical protein
MMHIRANLVPTLVLDLDFRGCGASLLSIVFMNARQRVKSCDLVHDTTSRAHGFRERGEDVAHLTPTHHVQRSY